MTESKPARRTGRPPLTDRATLLAAAREIGLASLTVGAVTSRVGVKYSTFYRHFSSLEALLTAVVDEIYSEADLPDPRGPWQEYVLELSEALFEVLAQHPGLALTVLRLPALPERAVEAYRRLTECLVAAGFDPDEAVLGATTILEVVMMPWLTASDGSVHKQDRESQIRSTSEPLDPQVRAAGVGVVDDPPRRWTRRKVELVINGLGTPASPVATSGRPTGP
ncbi:TetR/AcrR family transcriptional regulator [Pseudonocardia sp. KRD291]|uniref:TetR/AcrR family transcriptional regulator n=1 Tax=Pseudonocardia sp. KRD291 TaxID=2792007 RepID=UPI001C4A6DDE|nr:TetR/AcrR family transcriptional regulator [Pseudonocardia sp. KRD291]MBW0106577.1 TetR/AcrR family transcriptional regulator [Pseudonocardia sp. KRD291]